MICYCKSKLENPLFCMILSKFAIIAKLVAQMRYCQRAKHVLCDKESVQFSF